MMHVSNRLRIAGAAAVGIGVYSLYRREQRADYRSAFAVSQAALEILKAKPVEELTPLEACQELASYRGDATDAAHGFLQKRGTSSTHPVTSRKFLVSHTDCRDQGYYTPEMKRCQRVKETVFIDIEILSHAQLVCTYIAEQMPSDMLDDFKRENRVNLQKRGQFYPQNEA